MKPYHTTQRGHIYRARAEDVYPHLPDRSCSLVIWDGPYNMRKADWDKFDNWDAFRDWYRPHLEALDRVACQAASLYVWGNDESASQLRDMVAGAGWNRRVRVTWYKTGANPALIGSGFASVWVDLTEVCDVYTRGGPTFNSSKGVGNVWPLSPTNQVQSRLYSGEKSPHRVTGKMQKIGVHACQKPLAFWSRIIRASSRPGDTVLEPFGGTCRAAFACLDLPESEARRYVCIEPDEDGRDYLGAVVKSLRERQPTLWGVQ